MANGSSLIKRVQQRYNERQQTQPSVLKNVRDTEKKQQVSVSSGSSNNGGGSGSTTQPSSSQSTKTSTRPPTNLRDPRLQGKTGAALQAEVSRIAAENRQRAREDLLARSAIRNARQRGGVAAERAVKTAYETGGYKAAVAEAQRQVPKNRRISQQVNNVGATSGPQNIPKGAIAAQKAVSVQPVRYTRLEGGPTKENAYTLSLLSSAARINVAAQSGNVPARIVPALRLQEANLLKEASTGKVEAEFKVSTPSPNGELLGTYSIVSGNTEQKYPKAVSFVELVKKQDKLLGRTFTGKSSENIVPKSEKNINELSIAGAERSIRSKEYFKSGKILSGIKEYGRSVGFYTAAALGSVPISIKKEPGKFIKGTVLSAAIIGGATLAGGPVGGLAAAGTLTGTGTVLRGAETVKREGAIGLLSPRFTSETGLQLVSDVGFFSATNVALKGAGRIYSGAKGLVSAGKARVVRSENVLTTTDYTPSVKAAEYGQVSVVRSGKQGVVLSAKGKGAITDLDGEFRTQIGGNLKVVTGKGKSGLSGKFFSEIYNAEESVRGITRTAIKGKAQQAMAAAEVKPSIIEDINLVKGYVSETRPVKISAEEEIPFLKRGVRTKTEQTFTQTGLKSGFLSIKERIILGIQGKTKTQPFRGIYRLIAEVKTPEFSYEIIRGQFQTPSKTPYIQLLGPSPLKPPKVPIIRAPELIKPRAPIVERPRAPKLPKREGVSTKVSPESEARQKAIMEKLDKFNYDRDIQGLLDDLKNIREKKALDSIRKVSVKKTVSTKETPKAKEPQITTGKQKYKTINYEAASEVIDAQLSTLTLSKAKRSIRQNVFSETSQRFNTAIRWRGVSFPFTVSLGVQEAEKRAIKQPVSFLSAQATSRIQKKKSLTEVIHAVSFNTQYKKVLDVQQRRRTITRQESRVVSGFKNFIQPIPIPIIPPPGVGGGGLPPFGLGPLSGVRGATPARFKQRKLYTPSLVGIFSGKKEKYSEKELSKVLTTGYGVRGLPQDIGVL